MRDDCQPTAFSFSAAAMSASVLLCITCIDIICSIYILLYKIHNPRIILHVHIIIRYYVPHCTPTYHIVSYYIVSCCIILYDPCIMLYHIVLCQVVFYHIVSYDHNASCHIYLLYHVARSIISFYIIWHIWYHVIL